MNDTLLRWNGTYIFCISKQFMYMFVGPTESVVEFGIAGLWNDGLNSFLFPQETFDLEINGEDLRVGNQTKNHSKRLVF